MTDKHEHPPAESTPDSMTPPEKENFTTRRETTVLQRLVLGALSGSLGGPLGFLVIDDVMALWSIWKENACVVPAAILGGICGGLAARKFTHAKISAVLVGALGGLLAVAIAWFGLLGLYMIIGGQ